MGRFFQDLDYPHFDYHLGRLDQLPGWEFRGPVPDVTEPFFVCIGASQMFGRFCQDPHAQQLSRAIGLPVLNLGLSGSGPGVFIDEGFLAVINRARFAIVQVMSARCESNADFEGLKSGGATGILRRDGTSISFDAYMADKLANSSRDSVARAVEELRASWVSHYRDLLNAIQVPKVLHWFSTTTPRRSDDHSTWWKLLGPFPQLVNRRMIEQIIPFADSYVQTVRNLGLPQPLWAADRPVDGTEYYNGMLINNYYPSSEMHKAAARDLMSACKALAPRTASDGSGQDVTARDIVVISANELDGSVIADICGPGVIKISYGTLLEDRGLLPFLAARKPRFIHVRRRSLLDAFLGTLPYPSGGRDAVPEVYVEPVSFASYVQATSTAERRIARACGNSDLSEVYFEDFISDPTTVMSRIAEFTRKPVPRETDISTSMARITTHCAAQNTGELYALFNRILRNVPKPGE